MRYYTLKVLKLRYETTDALTIVLKQPAFKKIYYQPGQYLTLIFNINSRRYMRPYSFSSAPDVDQNIEITVKRVKGGIVSNHIIDRLKVDDLIEVMEPMGDFILDNNMISNNTHLFLWGAGSGITPLISLAKYALHKKIARHVTLIYGNRNVDSVIFKEKINELNTTYNSFSAYHFHTQPVIITNNTNDVIQGRINSDKVLAVMKNEEKISDSIHYICGPVGLKESVKTALSKLGINETYIFTEDFEITINSSDLINITTRMVSVRTENNKAVIEVIKGKSILEAGLDAMINLSYSCQTGNCLVCKAQVLNGKIKMLGTNTPKELQQDECLLCCSYPLTDDVEIFVKS